MGDYSQNYLGAICFLLFIIVVLIILGFIAHGSRDRDCRRNDDIDVHVSR